jgi:hypothetical protein
MCTPCAAPFVPGTESLPSVCASLCIAIQHRFSLGTRTQRTRPGSLSAIPASTHDMLPSVPVDRVPQSLGTWTRTLTSMLMRILLSADRMSGSTYSGLHSLLWVHVPTRGASSLALTDAHRSPLSQDEDPDEIVHERTVVRRFLLLNLFNSQFLAA